MASAFPSFTQFAPSTPDLPQDAATAERKRGLLGRFLDAQIEARQREAEQQVARLLARSGGTFTDSLEREATRSLLGR